VSALCYDLAAPADDPALRALLRSSPMAGEIRLTLECEPSYFDARALEGPIGQTVVGRLPDGTLLGMGTRTVRTAFVNGRPQPLGYFSQLRVAPRLAGSPAAARAVGAGFARLRELQREAPVPFHFLSVATENHAALRLLTAGLPGFPRVRAVGDVVTYALASPRRSGPARPAAGDAVVAGSWELAPAIRRCLERNGTRHQLAPSWGGLLFDPAHTPGLQPPSFRVALREGRVVGCAARWDQSAVKQAVVRGYGPRLARRLRLVNLAARIGGWPRLPPAGERLRASFLSHLAVDDDDPAVATALLRAIRRDGAERHDDCLLLGLAAGHPLAAAVGRRSVSYRTRLFVAWWPGDREPALDGRPLGAEVAVL
jgi:hypothetical protein